MLARSKIVHVSSNGVGGWGWGNAMVDRMGDAAVSDERMVFEGDYRVTLGVGMKELAT